jgi:hypothetical protein
MKIKEGFSATMLMTCALSQRPSLRAKRSNPGGHMPGLSLAPGLLRGACHPAALRADRVARNDGWGERRASAARIGENGGIVDHLAVSGAEAS